MSESLFDDFVSTSSKAWKQKIQVDLKGADYNESLIWQSLEDIAIKPFYHNDLLRSLDTHVINRNSNWKIGQNVAVVNSIEANEKIKILVQKGVNSITLDITDPNISVEKLFKGLDCSKMEFHLNIKFLSSSFIKKLANSTVAKVSHLNIDLIGNFARTGNWFNDSKDDHKNLEHIVTSHLNTFNSIFSIDARLYQNAGANMVQQLAYALAHSNEYLNHFGKKIGEPVFKIAVSTNYFFEIAKIRALRVLWKALANEYNTTDTCKIVVVPSKRNKTIYDYNTNMLRTTTECMSAILGSADVITNLSYDSIYHKENEFGERIARNQLLILKYESYFDKVANPSDGTYYIEELTSILAEKSLVLFKQIEKNGGFLKQLFAGTIQRKINESANKEQALFDNGNEVLLGTNKYPNTMDKMNDTIEKYPFVKKNKRKTQIAPIIEKRLAEKIEQGRLKLEVEKK